MTVPMALPRSPRLAAAVLALSGLAALVSSAPSRAATSPCAATDVTAPAAPAATIGRAMGGGVKGPRLEHRR